MPRFLIDYKVTTRNCCEDFAILLWDNPDNEFEFETEEVELADLCFLLMSYSEELRDIDGYMSKYEGGYFDEEDEDA